MKTAFRLYFNYRRQFVNTYFWSVHPTTFDNWGGGYWGYYEPCPVRNGKGLFSELHFVKSRVREDVFEHEKIHLLGDILRSKKRVWSVYNEEWLARLAGGLTRDFWREYRKL